MFPEYTMKLPGGYLRWRCEYDDSCRLECVAADGHLYALETEESGFHLLTDGKSWRASAVFDNRGTMSFSGDCLEWTREYPEYGVQVGQTWRRLDDETIEFTCRLLARRKIRRPQLSYGMRYVLPPYFNRFAYAHCPTQMGYSFQEEQGINTLWMYSMPPVEGDDSPYAGCQALVAENPDPSNLEIHLRMPPGYVGEVKKEYEIEEGQVLTIRGAVALRPGEFSAHAEVNERLLGREVLPRRYDYRKYIEMALDNFLDEHKYHAEGNGIIYYSAVDGDIDNPRFQYWTEGPSWGGAFDAENAVNLVRLSRYFPERREQLLSHARRMLHGWLDNPRFRVPEGSYAETPGDFDEAYVTTGWFMDCIWTIAQADLVYRLTELHLLAGWEECLPAARRLGNWLLKQMSPDGTIPSLWQFPVVYPPELNDGWRPEYSRCKRSGSRIQVLYDTQPTGCAVLSLAFRKLAEADVEGAGKWNEAADRLMQYVIREIQVPLANFGNGENDYLVYRTNSIDPTGIAYIICALARQHRETLDSRIPALVRKFMDIYSCFSVHWDCRETRMRPEDKCTMGEYGADVRMAGGITHGNWQPVYRRGFGQRFNLLMNRNEIAEGMLAGWQVTGDPRDKALLRSYANWQTYFQFTREISASPVTTKGSCQQNHFWTSDFGNWNNDYALTAFKWTGSFCNLLEAGIDG